MIENRMKPTGKKKKKQWTILCVSDEGRVVVKNGLWRSLVAASVLFLVCVVLAAGFFVLFEKSRTEYKALKSEIARLEKKLSLVHNEKNRQLIRRIRINESRQIRANQNEVGETDASEAPDNQNPGGRAANSGVSVSSDSQTDSVPVVLEDFSIRPLENGCFRVRFKVANNLDASKPVSGYVFVVMKNEDPEQTGWICLPKGDLENGRPVEVEKGFSFSISNYKYIRTRSEVPLDKEWTIASVMVFGKDGAFIAQRDFSIPKDDEGGSSS